MKLAFFDVDGTLSAPQYPVNGKPEIGVTEGWMEYCIENGNHTYADCKPVKIVGDYAKQLKSQGVVLYALSTSQSSFEHDAKEQFLEDNYPGVFLSLITVSRDELKLKVIEKMAEKMNVRIEDCELVEDTYATLLQAGKMGIKATHISQLMV